MVLLRLSKRGNLGRRFKEYIGKYTYANGIDMKGVKKWPETVTRRVHPLLLFLKVRKPQIPRFKSSGTIVHLTSPTEMAKERAE